MIWTAWKNGKHNSPGVAYGLTVPAQDRDRYFSRSWRTIILELPTTAGAIQVEINIAKGSFWGGCRELIDKEIGEWLIQRGLVPWPKGRPPRFNVIQRLGRRFVVVDEIP